MRWVLQLTEPHSVPYLIIPAIDNHQKFHSATSSSSQKATHSTRCISFTFVSLLILTKKMKGVACVMVSSCRCWCAVELASYKEVCYWKASSQCLFVSRGELCGINSYSAGSCSLFSLFLCTLSSIATLSSTVSFPIHILMKLLNTKINDKHWWWETCVSHYKCIDFSVWDKVLPSHYA